MCSEETFPPSETKIFLQNEDIVPMTGPYACQTSVQLLYTFETNKNLNTLLS